MKPLFTFILLLLCLEIVAQPPAFTDPNIVEDVYPNPSDADLREPVSHATAYSYGSLNIGGTNSDLYVYTWDNGDGLPTSVGSGAAGFAVRQYASGTMVQSSTAPLFEDAIIVGDPVFPTPYIGSLEAGILREGTTTYIVVTYYAGDWLPPIFEGFYYVDLYEWTAGGLVQVGGYPQMLNGATGPVQPGWIHHDVNELSELVVVWNENGEIHTLTGNMSGAGLQLTGTGILDNPGFNTTLTKPDVTMFRDIGNEITLYYVFTSVAGNVLFVTSASYNNLAALPAGSINPYPVNIIDEASGAGVYDVPRIDAPDHALYAGHEAWSYVVSEHLPDRDLIFTGFYNDQAGGQQHYYLNDGSLGTIDLSGNPTQDPAIYSQRAVVAFSNDVNDMYYGWCFRNQGYIANAYGWNAPGVYASLKLDAFANVLNTVGGTGAFDYSRVQDNTTTTDYMPSVAFSTQNDNSPRLFASFFQNFLGEQNYFIGVKTTDWTSALFRPGTLGIAESRIDADLTIYPNPFQESFTIAVDGVAPDAVFNLSITDLSGRVLYSLSGLVNALNQQLSIPARQLGAGVYFMRLQDAAGKLKDLRKLVKL